MEDGADGVARSSLRGLKIPNEKGHDVDADATCA